MRKLGENFTTDGLQGLESLDWMPAVFVSVGSGKSLPATFAFVASGKSDLSTTFVFWCNGKSHSGPSLGVLGP